MMRPITNFGSLAGQTAWIFSDEKAGHEAQSLGVAEALGLEAVIKRVRPEGLLKWTAPWGARRLPTNDASADLKPPFPVFAFAAGRTTIPYLRALKRAAGLSTFTVILMDPKTGPRSADLIWVPEHDRRRGANVVTTLTAPHRFSESRIRALRRHTPPDIAELPHPRIACLIGGPSSDYRFAPADEDRLVQSLDGLERDYSLMIAASPRTPDRVVAKLRDVSSGRRVIFSDGSGHNPYPDFLAHADAFVVSADSVSMISEAAATGRPIYVFSPSGGRAKFKRFHAALSAYGATRALPGAGERLESWNYEPLHSAEIIAAEIARRWQRRVELLPGLVGSRAR